MKHLKLLLAIVSFTFICDTANAQSCKIYCDSIEVKPGDSAIVDFKVENFRQIYNMSGTITFDTAVIKYDGISRMLLPYMTAATFDFTNAVNGEISWNWLHLINIGSSLNNGSVVFSLRFNAVGRNGEATPISFSNVPRRLYWFNGFGASGVLDTLSGQVKLSCSPVNAVTSSFLPNINGTRATFADKSSITTTHWTWNFGDGNTSTLQNPQHTYAIADTFNVCLVASNLCYADTTCQKIVTFFLPAVQQLENDLQLKAVLLNNSLLQVDCSNCNGPCLVEIYDLKGAKIQAFTMYSSTATFALDQKLQAGVYLVKCQANGKVYTSKIAIN